MKKFSMLLAGLLFSTISFADPLVLPAPGLWNIDEELNGQPGRGFQIELQGDVIVFTYFGYTEQGDATFYIADGFFNGVLFLGEMIEVAGGTALGGEFQNGQVVENIGIVRLEFDSPTTGTIRLPGEEEKEISKYAFSDPKKLFETDEDYEGVVYSAGIFNMDDSTYTFTFEEEAQITIERNSRFNSDCVYSGFYVAAGNGLHATGTYVCSDNTTGEFVADGLTVNSLGVYTGTVTRFPEDSDMEIEEIHTGLLEDQF